MANFYFFEGLLSRPLWGFVVDCRGVDCWFFLMSFPVFILFGCNGFSALLLY